MPAIYPFDLPAQQLPQPTDRLSDGFLHALPATLGLWMPSKLALAAADFTPLPQKHFGSLNGGITTTPDGFGMFGAAWKFNGSSGYSSRALAARTTDYSLVVSFKTTTASASMLCGWDNASDGSSGTSDNTIYIDGTGKIVFYLANPGGSTITSAATYNDGKWHRAIATWKASGTLGTLYVDGASQGTVIASPYTGYTTPYFMIGYTDLARHPNHFAGSILEVAILGAALSVGQVGTLESCLRTGEPFPLFEPQTVPMMFGSAAAPAAGRGGFLIGGGIGDFLCAA